MHSVKFIGFAVMVLMLLTGCGDQRILENLGFISALGLDLVPLEEGESMNRVKITAAIPKPSSEGKIEHEVIDSEAKTIKDARLMLSRKSELQLVTGQTRDILFSMDMAKSGLWTYFDALRRDPTISQRTKIVVVDGSANELLSAEYPKHPRTSEYIHLLLEKEAQQKNIPDIALYEFTRDYLEDGIDPITTILKKDTKYISVDGIALFHKDRYVGKIPTDKILIYGILRRNFNGGELGFNLDKYGRSKEIVMMNALVSERKIRVVAADVRTRRFTLEIKISLKGTLTEYIGDLDLGKAENRRKLEQAMSGFLAKESETLISEMQKQKADSLGFGTQIRNRIGYDNWKNLHWEDVYPNVKIRCKTEVKIQNVGEISSSAGSQAQHHDTEQR